MKFHGEFDLLLLFCREHVKPASIALLQRIDMHALELNVASA